MLNLPCSVSCSSRFVSSSNDSNSDFRKTLQNVVIFAAIHDQTFQNPVINSGSNIILPPWGTPLLWEGEPQTL